MLLFKRGCQFYNGDSKNNDYKNIFPGQVIAPKIWANFGGLFIMKLTDENKIQIYRLKREVYLYMELSKKFEINDSNMKYIINLADLYGKTVLIRREYSPELKLNTINKVLKSMIEDGL